MKKEFKSLTEELNRIKELSGVKLVKENKISKNDLITALTGSGKLNFLTALTGLGQFKA